MVAVLAHAVVRLGEGRLGQAERTQDHLAEVRATAVVAEEGTTYVYERDVVPRAEQYSALRAVRTIHEDHRGDLHVRRRVSPQLGSHGTDEPLGVDGVGHHLHRSVRDLVLEADHLGGVERFDLVEYHGCRDAHKEVLPVEPRHHTNVET